MKNRLVLVFLAAIILVVGVIIGVERSGEQLNSALQLSEPPSYHVVYDRPESGIQSYFSETDNPELYAYNGNRKLVYSNPLLGRGQVEATFDYEGRRIECSETNIRAASDLNCMLNSSSDYSEVVLQDYREMEDVNVSSEGTMTILGRECNRYIVDIPPGKLDYLEGYGGSMILCIDQQKEYPALIELNRTREYELQTDTTENVFRMKARTYSEDVSASDVQPPVDVAVKLVCDSSRTARALKAYPIDYEGNITITVDGENQTAPVNAGEVREIPLSRAESFWNRQDAVRVYTENGLSSVSRCSFWS